MFSDHGGYELQGADRFYDYKGKVRRYMELARRVAFQSCFPDYRHGAVLARGGSVINTSHNKGKFCSFGHRFRKKEFGKATVHAELGVILGLERSITEGATVYVARVGRSGDFRMSKPCHMCHGALKHVGVKRVVYTIDNEVAGSYRL